jgi:hypothetical protein
VRRGSLPWGNITAFWPVTLSEAKGHTSAGGSFTSLRITTRDEVEGEAWKRFDNERSWRNAMRQVILQGFVSLGGLAAGPNASVDFVPAATKDDHSFEQHQLRFTETIDTILLNLTPKLVFSKTLDRAPWAARPFDRGEVAFKYTWTGR